MAVRRTYDVTKTQEDVVVEAGCFRHDAEAGYVHTHTEIDVVQNKHGVRMVQFGDHLFSARQLESIATYLSNGGFYELREQRPDGTYRYRSGANREQRWEKVS